ncbi:MAG: RluA family pseudouridine synthase [Alphaproteobacteria bacterium]|nr:RluA family pseudouridine synthase [Alphaproteobacteria bacterium]
MGQVELIKVKPQDDGMRLNRWFLKYYPDLPMSRLQKLLRTKQIKVDGQKAMAALKLVQGQEVRIPPLTAANAADRKNELDAKDVKFVLSLVIYKDENIIVLNKPSGVAVQGGTNTKFHIDGLLEALKFGNEEAPKLVHRIDKDTSGVLVLARNRQSAVALTKAFKEHRVQKTYAAIVNGRPAKSKMRIDAPLDKIGEKMMVTPNGQPALSEMEVIDAAGDDFALVKLKPLSGRTHQLRVHMLHIGNPIVGDGKYFLPNEKRIRDIADKLYLHAYKIDLSNIYKNVIIKAELPEYFVEALRFLGLRLDKNI